MDDLNAQTMELLQECIVTSADEECGVDPGKMKTLSAYVDSTLAITYQAARSMTLIPPTGGSATARDLAEDVSQIVDMQHILNALTNPAVMRMASKL